MIKLPKPVEFSDAIQPVNLACSSTNNNVNVIAIGNGLVHTKADDIAPILQYASMRTVSKERCSQYIPIPPFRKSIICAKGIENQSVCRGDSGGPLIDASNLNLVGIASFGSHLNNCNGPQSFTHVPKYIQWIEDIAGVACACLTCNSYHKFESVDEI